MVPDTFIFPPISRYRGGSTNLRTQLQRIISKAGVKPWPKLWHNLRASCQTDLARVFPLKSVCDWLGNSALVAMTNYIQSTESDFQRAIGNPTQTVAARGCHEHITLAKALGKSLEHSVLPSRRVGVTGIEPVTPSV